MSPLSASSKPAITLKTVVFPQPDGPMMLTKSRSLMSNVRPPSTSTGPAFPAKDFRMLRNASCTAMPIPFQRLPRLKLHAARQSAVHHQVRSAHEARRRAGDERDRVGDLL